MNNMYRNFYRTCILIMTLLILFVGVSAIHAQSKPTQNACDRVLLEEFANWRLNFERVTSNFDTNPLDLPFALLDDASDYGLSECDYVRAEYLEYVALVYASSLAGVLDGLSTYPEFNTSREFWSIMDYAVDMGLMFDFIPIPTGQGA